MMHGYRGFCCRTSHKVSKWLYKDKTLQRNKKCICASLSSARTWSRSGCGVCSGACRAWWACRATSGPGCRALSPCLSKHLWTSRHHSRCRPAATLPRADCSARPPRRCSRWPGLRSWRSGSGDHRHRWRHATWCSCRPSCGRSDGPSGRLPPLFRPQAGRRAMRFEIGRVDHHRLRDGGLGGKPSHHPGKDPLIAPPLPPVVEGLRRAILLWRITPPQAVAIDEDNPTQNPPVINPRLAVAFGKKGPQPRHLRFRQPEKVAHRSISLRRLNHATRG